ncbi:DUF4856 domain-containing protein [Marinoscillum furvescens]|uniref:Uncharacterized protein DUF4856 n=1 Tax=Marinoscillum furvescens DSM 4134 TaxID=1122208 RepID=A0A3D9L4K3_MARFU|nr:DUF4856 domain-containing protein [Marinoscillum furvescens]REE00449.1 uncharacterized protein DUF4856 [Marinoscillum furvescens DSM 4134]
MKIQNKLTSLFAITLLVLFASCEDSDDPQPQDDQLAVPSTYEFTRNGESSVDYSGQTARLNMLAELKSYIATSHEGATLDEQKLLNMFANENDPFEDATLNASTKQLENKTFVADVEFFKDILSSAATVSVDAGDAAEGQGGLIARSPDNKILVDEKGWEYTQLIEKGLMGATFLHQIYNSYLTDAKIGNDVENEELSEGKNYTAMEHHWDEAFGYWGVNPEFDTEGDNQFWGKYTYGRESYLGSATALKDAFLKGRTAIVNKDYDERDAQRDIIYEQFEITAAATAIHYINESITDLNNADQGNLFHHLSEGYGFVLALKYSPYKQISTAEIEVILEEDFGTDGDFWTVTVEGLNKAKSTLVATYPSLKDIADEL